MHFPFSDPHSANPIPHSSFPIPHSQTLTLEVGDTRIIEQPVLEEGEREREGEGEGWRLPLRYHHFRSERIETLLHHACQLLGFYGGR